MCFTKKKENNSTTQKTIVKEDLSGLSIVELSNKMFEYFNEFSVNFNKENYSKLMNSINATEKLIPSLSAMKQVQLGPLVDGIKKICVVFEQALPPGEKGKQILEQQKAVILANINGVRMCASMKLPGEEQ